MLEYQDGDVPTPSLVVRVDVPDEEAASHLATREKNLAADPNMEINISMGSIGRLNAWENVGNRAREENRRACFVEKKKREEKSFERYEARKRQV